MKRTTKVTGKGKTGGDRTAGQMAMVRDRYGAGTGMGAGTQSGKPKPKVTVRPARVVGNPGVRVKVRY
ncbi:MAG: hypothetical protein U5N55_04955 [Cypionkella sp.]|nr:hypothetical protein [Cypionkella sp.]